jgi:rare lipoprotein A
LGVVELKKVMPFRSKKRSFAAVALSIAVCGLFWLWVYGCATDSPPPTPPGHPKAYRIGKNWYQPLPHARDFKQRGKASWYGKKFHGRKTANGETYNMYGMTAAHKTLPLGTYVRVQNLKNDKTIEVRVNDRGPFVRGRIIDLSYTAAKKLDIVGPGTAPVEVVALGRVSKASGTAKRSYVPVDYYKGDFTIQVGAFSDRNNAERLRKKLDEKYINAHITTYNDGYNTFHRVRVGKFSSLEQAEKSEGYMIQNGFEDAFAIAED